MQKEDPRSWSMYSPVLQVTNTHKAWSYARQAVGMRAAGSYFESTDCKTLITPFKTDKPATTKTTYLPSPYRS